MPHVTCKYFVVGGLCEMKRFNVKLGGLVKVRVWQLQVVITLAIAVGVLIWLEKTGRIRSQDPIAACRDRVRVITSEERGEWFAEEPDPRADAGDKLPTPEDLYRSLEGADAGAR